jgi:hypothetical protein
VRVNAAAGLVDAGMSTAEAVEALAGRFSVSARQARRYLERAAANGRVAVPGETAVFTVKLPAALVARVRKRAKTSGSTISALVALALTEFLLRGNGKRPRR